MALVPIGGDDTLSVAAAIARGGLPDRGVPKTIDNDLSVTEFCIGFDTAVGVVTEALDRLHTTASAHHRVMVVEVMGRDAGWVAMMGGIAGGADLILIPEFEVTLKEVVGHLYRRRGEGKLFSIIVVAEGAKIPEFEAEAEGPGREGRVRTRQACQARNRRPARGQRGARDRLRDARDRARAPAARRIAVPDGQDLGDSPRRRGRRADRRRQERGDPDQAER